MAYETADYINGLDKNLPKSSDSISEGDIHIKLIKDVLKNSFPNVDSEVNVIHTSDTEPKLFSTGTVWFDTSTGLIKMRNIDNTKWMVMAHGDSTGLGNLIRVYTLTWDQQASYRSSTWQKLTSWMISPETSNSTMYFDISGEVSVWGNDAREENRIKFKDDTNDSDVGFDRRVIGFNHVDDAGNFEIEGMFNMKVNKANHGGTPFELSMYGKHNIGGGGSYAANVTLVVNEYE